MGLHTGNFDLHAITHVGQAPMNIEELKVVVPSGQDGRKAKHQSVVT